jgi:hypothetical protein
MKLKLPNVTAVCMQGYGPEKDMLYKNVCDRLRMALPYMLRFFEFKEIILIAPEDLNIEGITYHHTKPLTYNEYQSWRLHQMSDYVDTEFCLMFQDDGFPLNPDMWRDEFFEYDYVGAPITKDMGILYKEEMIGGGGFTLNSKRLLEFTKKIPQPNEYGFYVNEDTSIAVAYRDEIVSLGMKICPHTIARHFSIQNPIDDQVSLYNTFGFHGRDQKLETVEKIIRERMV